MRIRMNEDSTATSNQQLLVSLFFTIEYITQHFQWDCSRFRFQSTTTRIPRRFSQAVIMSTLDQQFVDSSCFCSHKTAGKSTRDLQQTMFTKEGDQKGKEEVDTLLSEALNDLTFEERKMQQEVVHGVDDKIAEEETFIKTRLQELDVNLLLIKAGRTYEAAEMMNKEYVSTRSFRLMFLRANRYDSKAAAEQMLSFFDVKQQLFGMDKLVKDITMEDLDEDDLECLQSGFIQFAGRDRADRQITIELPGLRVAKTLKNELRTRYYMMMSCLESEKNQLRGNVGIAWTIGEYREKENGSVETIEMAAALPVQCAAIHFCTDEIGKYVICKMLVKAMSSKFRARFTPHFGSQLECSYRLSTYGISPGMLPFTPGTNQVVLDYHKHWFHSRFAKERRSQPVLVQSLLAPASVPITEPRIPDVLFMGGKKCRNQGNERLRALVKSLIPVYSSGTNEEKRVIVDGLIGNVEREGGRFLEKKSGPYDAWEELGLDKSRIKVMQMFRNLGRQRTTSMLEPDGIPIADEPRPDDVVFGNLQRSRGSELLQQMISDRSKEYDDLDRGMKLKLVESVMERIKGQGGRFLQALPESAGEWMEVPNDDARKRISKYFRNKRRASRRRVK